MTDERLAHVTERLAALPGVQAVTLGGSRGPGTHRPDSDWDWDWDFTLHYGGGSAPADLRAVGWVGEVSEVGAWGGGVFNRGAWLTIDGRHVDVHYRDLDVVELHWEPLMFHLRASRATWWWPSSPSTARCTAACRAPTTP